MTSREFFGGVREASRDAERIQRQLQAMHERAALPARQSWPRSQARGGMANDRLGGAVVAMVSAEERLKERLEHNYAMLDLATATLYGTDLHEGLSAFVPNWVCDSIYQHYVNGLSWPEVARLVGYERRYVLGKVSGAFALMDANGMTATIEGA